MKAYEPDAHTQGEREGGEDVKEFLKKFKGL